MPTKKPGVKRQSRTVTWDSRATRTAVTMSGLDYLHGMKDGRIPPPPAWSLVGCRLTEVDTGRVVCQFTPAEHLCNRFGKVQGGILCVVIDAAMGSAISSVLSPGMSFTTPEIKVNYFRPITGDNGTMSCESTIIHRGDRIAVLEARVLDATGRLYAHALSTFMILHETKES